MVINESKELFPFWR